MTSSYYNRRVRIRDFWAGPPGISVLNMTNSRSSFGKVPKIPIGSMELMTYLQANTFIVRVA